MVTVGEAVRRVIIEHAEMLEAVRLARPKAWGALAAAGVIAFRDLNDRAPTDAERRAIWAALWRRATAEPSPHVSGEHGIRELLERAIAEEPCEAILLSGGLDTSIAASLGVRHGLRLAVTVVVDDSAPDLPYAIGAARRLRLDHVVLRRSLDDLARSVPAVIEAIGSFDGMFLRNDVVVYEGLREVAARGMRTCWTGDAADELFAGYSFVFNKAPDEIERTIAQCAGSMHFNGPALGALVDVAVRSPYLHPAVVEHALTLRGAELVLERDGQRLGKAPLRRAFAPEIGDEHAYRRKDPIEIGSGATRLKEHMAASVGDFEAAAASILAQDGVRVRDAERIAYYRMYRDVFGGPPRADVSLPKECPDCHARGPDGTYCRVCGAYPI